MTAERWELVKSLFELALTVGPDGRAAFLEEHCGPDEELRREVISLLESHDDSDEFLETPVMSVKDMVDVPISPSIRMVGKRIGAWEVVREIGRGGMGAVFLAVRADNEFQKRVAIKLIRGGMESDFLIRRFRRERQILARLEHPYIARLIDGGATPDGLPYFVMEYVEGESLGQYCEARGLELRERLEILLKACSAVHYAHRRMIVHRDLKPGNILVKEDGTPKLLDFGIAKLLDPTTADSPSETTAGAFRIVTPAYASPEQMRGEPATVRSDIYALGVILYELAAGRRPLTTAGEDPLALPASVANGASGALAKKLCVVARRAVRAEPNERYESVEPFMADIQRCIAGEAIPSYSSTITATIELPSPSPGSVAVLPFRLLGTDSTTDGYLGLGITDALITKLSNVGRISVRSTGAVMKYAGVADPMAAARELGVEHVLEGRIQKLGNRVRVTVQLVRAPSDVPVWAASFDEQLEDLLRVEDSISEQVAQAVAPQLTGEEKEQLAKPGTASAKAHQAYLRGRFHWSQGTRDALARALVAFMQAIAEDPDYAQAHAGVADYYVQLGIHGGMPPAESFAAAKQSAETALERDPNLAEAHASLGFATWAYDRDYASAAHQFQLAIALNPDYAPAHHWLGLLNSARGRHEMAIACLSRARKLDPSRPTYPADLALCYSNARRFDKAVETCEEAIRTHGDTAELTATLALNQRLCGRLAEATEACERSRKQPGESLFATVAYAGVAAAKGDASVARVLLDEIRQSSDSAYVPGCLLAQLHLAAGDRQRALDELERSLNDRDWWALWIGVSPVWDELRTDPRFLELMRAQPSEAAAVSQETVDALVRPSRKRPAWRRVAAAAALAFVCIAGVASYRLFGPRPAPFSRSTMVKLTTSGIAGRAAISPDGQFVAYTENENGRPVVWVREVNGNTPYRIAGPLAGEIRSLDFTRDGKQVSFLTAPANEPANGELYTAPIGGGAPVRLMVGAPGPAAVSPDGKRLAFYRPSVARAMDELVIRNVEGGGERVIASRRYPDRYSWATPAAWSSDGKRLACAVESSDTEGFHAGLAVVEASGLTSVVQSPRFQWVGRVRWADGDRGLMVIGQEHNSSFQQIWYVPFRGEARRISGGLTDFASLAVTDDGSAMVSVAQQTLTNVFVLSGNDPAHGIQLTPSGGRYFDLAWAPGGRLAYASDGTGTADLWMMNADGSGQRQLTHGQGRSYAPAASRDGRVAFHSNRDGNWNIWLLDPDSLAARPLTKGARDSNWPRFSPDGKYVYFHHTGLNARFNVWRAPVDGGTAEQVLNSMTQRPAIASDGRIAAWYSAEAANPKWKIGIFAPGRGEPVKVLGTPDTVSPDTQLGWTPHNDGISYIDNAGGVGNIWVLPLDGKPARALTRFDWGQVFSFDWSQDGKLAYSRGMTSSDVVLFRNLTKTGASSRERP